MGSRKLQIVSIFLLNLLAVSSLPKKVRIIKFAHCHPRTDYPLKVSATFHTVRDVQYLDYNGTYLIPYVYNASVHVHVAISRTGNKFVHLISLRNNDVCEYQRKYMGEFYYLILERSGLKRDTCPIPAGIYASKHMRIDFGNVPIDALPSGYVRVRQMIIQAYSKKILNCVDIELTNVT